MVNAEALVFVLDSGFECTDTIAFLHVFTLVYATNRIKCQSRPTRQIFTCSTSTVYTAKKRKFFIKNFLSKCYQIRRKLRIWSHLLKKSLMKCSSFFKVLSGNVVLTQKQPLEMSHKIGVLNLKILQNLQEETCTGTAFVKLQASSLQFATLLAHSFPMHLFSIP